MRRTPGPVLKVARDVILILYGAVEQSSLPILILKRQPRKESDTTISLNVAEMDIVPFEGFKKIALLSPGQASRLQLLALTGNRQTFRYARQQDNCSSHPRTQSFSLPISRLHIKRYDTSALWSWKSRPMFRRRRLINRGHLAGMS